MIVVILAGLLAASQSHRDPGCTEWQQCRAMALAAADRGEYETFHDLAWRAVQTGPAKDPALLYLLARAQALSGRPHDALVMVDRLALMGVASDADSNDDFSRARQLPEWPEVAARIERLRTPASPAAAVTPAARPAAAPKPAPPPAAPSAAAATPPAPPPDPVIAPASASPPAPAAPAPAVRVAKTEALRFSTDRASVVGLAYDAVSRRILFADRVARKLIVVSEGSNQPLDLVRAESAGFHDISAIEIDDRRGDLWVTSAPDVDGAGTLHRLQLVSGRPLKAFRIPPDTTPVELVDVAITRGGTVLVLDAAKGRILQLRPGASAVERLMRIDVPAPISLTVGSDDTLAYVAHQNGISLIDLRTRTAKAVSSPKGISIGGLQRLRFHRNALIGVTAEQSSTRIVRFDLNTNGRSVKGATTIEAAAPLVAQASVTITGDDLLYLAPVVAGATEFVAYRVHLR